ncbi:hypothetical protein J3R83DRAFT_13373 [Lanmaoa asiatica]|nr:hypothetical protein J3R83DRAFT_13373 [Lanmaoa asiatica]
MSMLTFREQPAAGLQLSTSYCSPSLTPDLNSNCPREYVASNADPTLTQFFKSVQQIQNEVPLPSHIFQLANNAYYRMWRTAQDQSLIRYDPFFVHSKC